MTQSLNKATVVQRIQDEGDTIPDLIAWTKNQPASRLPSTYNRPNNIWKFLMAFRDQRLEKLPDIVTVESIAYLLKSDDKKDWMLYAVLVWILEQYNTYGMHETNNKKTIIGLFQEVQSKQAVTI
jgi:hypothetical protein